MTEHDPAAPHFAPLLARLAACDAQSDYESPAILEEVERAVRAARSANVPPEYMVAYLRRRGHDVPLAGVGDWYRGVLFDRLVLRTIEADFEMDSGPTIVQSAAG